MPSGIISDIIARIVGEVVVYGLGYWTGFVFLSIITLGNLPMAPLMTIHEKNRSKRRWHQNDWSIWLHQPMKGKLLKADCVLAVGLVIWFVIGFGIYFLHRAGN